MALLTYEKKINSNLCVIVSIGHLNDGGAAEVDGGRNPSSSPLRRRVRRHIDLMTVQS